MACERAPGSRSDVETRTGNPARTATRTEPTQALAEPPKQALPTEALPAPTKPAPAISVPRTSTEAPRPSRMDPARAEVVDTSADVPAPPSDEPTEYASWLSHLPRTQQRRIAKLCRANPLRYLAECGGIGPLHIPLPPRISAAVRKTPEARRSRFLSMEDWRQALTPAQARYVERECPGGEDQPSSDLCGENTPVVVAFENQPVRFTRERATLQWRDARGGRHEGSVVDVYLPLR